MKVVLVALIAPIACVLLSPVSNAQSIAPAPTSQQALPLNVIPEGTAIQIELQDELKSGDVQDGSTVHFEVVTAVSNASGILIPSGCAAYGHVTESKKSGFFGQPGKLTFTCDYVQLSSGVQVPLRSQALSNHGGDSRTASVATAILFTPLTLFARGGNAKAHKGQQFTMYVDHDTAITTAAPAAPSAQSTAAKSLFILASGGQVVGSLVSFDGQSYVVGTDQGNMTLKTSDVKAVYAITNNLPPASSTPPSAPAIPAPAPPNAPAAPAAHPAPSAPTAQTPPPPAPAAPANLPSSQPPAQAPAPPPPAIDPAVIGTSQHVIVATNDGNSYYGTITKLDGTTYTLVNRQGTIQVQSTDIKTVQYPDRQ